MINSIRQYFRKKTPGPVVQAAEEAYDTWSTSYDAQPGNLMLELDEIIFSKLLSATDLENKNIIDIGCGTGRHWPKLLREKPASLTGYDVSAGMLAQLQKKYPSAVTGLSTDNLLNDIEDDSVDCIISTLTVAHMKNIEEAILSWSRVLKKGGDIIITDFHPTLLEQGGKRSFQHENKSFEVINYVHPLETIKNLFDGLSFELISEEIKIIDDPVKFYYEAKNALAVYERFKNMPVIYGLHVKK